MSGNAMIAAWSGRRWNPRLVSAITLSLVFLCGGAAGALLMNTNLHARLHAYSLVTPDSKSVYFERIQKELDLTPAQSEQMQSVLEDMWQYYRVVLSDSKSRVNLILTPVQREKFQKLIREAQKP
jgi:hypothetical protein